MGFDGMACDMSRYFKDVNEAVAVLVGTTVWFVHLVLKDGMLGPSLHLAISTVEVPGNL